MACESLDVFALYISIALNCIFIVLAILTPCALRRYGHIFGLSINSVSDSSNEQCVCKKSDKDDVEGLPRPSVQKPPAKLPVPLIVVGYNQQQIEPSTPFTPYEIISKKGSVTTNTPSPMSNANNKSQELIIPQNVFFPSGSRKSDSSRNSDSSNSSKAQPTVNPDGYITMGPGKGFMKRSIDELTKSQESLKANSKNLTSEGYMIMKPSILSSQSIENMSIESQG